MKTRRESVLITLDIPFQKKKFLLWLALSIVLTVVGTLVAQVPQIGISGIVILLVVYFIPTLLAFDVMDSYNEEYNIPKLKHPERFLIFIGNLLLGWTLVGWILSLFFALKPGGVIVERVTYSAIVE